MRGSVKYTPLATDEESSVQDITVPQLNRRNRILRLVCIVQSIALFAYTVVFLKGLPRASEPKLIYSPAYEAVEYEVKSFTVGRESWKGLTKWQGKGPEVDAAWKELYDKTVLRIPKSQAAQLPNRTYPVYGDDGYYIAALDVFHQLHCLNAVRMAFYKDHYADFPDVELTEEHTMHCIDSIRQSLMCNTDISVNVWQWNEDLDIVVGYSSQAHQCRNFEKIRDWAQAHRLHQMPDFSHHLEDDLVWPNVNY